jgi:hypothetical protein
MLRRSSLGALSGRLHTFQPAACLRSYRRISNVAAMPRILGAMLIVVVTLQAVLLVGAGPDKADRVDQSPGFEKPPEGCLDMDDPRIQDTADPRRKKYKIEICCLAPDDPRAASPDDPRRKKYREYAVRVCGPDVRALMIESLKRHSVHHEIAELRFDLLARDGSKQVYNVELRRSQVPNPRAPGALGLEERAHWKFLAVAGETGRAKEERHFSGLEGTELWLAGAERSLFLPAFGTRKKLLPSDLKERLADTDFLFADLIPHEPDNYDYYFREMQGEGAEESYVFSALSRDELGADYPYIGQRIWLRKRDLFVTKIRMFDRANHPWKEMRFEPNSIVVEDSQRRHRTVVTITRRSQEPSKK